MTLYGAIGFRAQLGALENRPFLELMPPKVW